MPERAGSGPQGALAGTGVWQRVWRMLSQIFVGAVGFQIVATIVRSYWPWLG